MRRIKEAIEKERSIGLEEVGVGHRFAAGSQRRVVMSVIARTIELDY